MKLRRTLSILMLAVYLFSICSYAFVVLTCHCHAATHCTTEQTCQCHHCRANYSGDGITQDNACHCLHSHSTNIELYDIAKSHNKYIASPLTAKYIISAVDSRVSEPTVQIVEALRIKRKIPLTHYCIISARSLRAPPLTA